MGKLLSQLLYGFLLTVLFAADAAAQADVSDIAENMSDSVSLLPGLLAGVAYLLALVIGVMGVIKLKEHVENSNTPISAAAIRFAVAGALIALPIVLEAMVNTISGGNGDGGFSGLINSVSAGLSGVVNVDLSGVNTLLSNVVNSVSLVPALITGVAYLLGLLMGYAAILKIKEHVENPSNTKLSEGVIRLIIGGALFALPTIYAAAFVTITGSGGFINGSILSQVFMGGSVMNSHQDLGTCQQGRGTFGSLMCSAILTTAATPAFLNAMSYLFGLVLGLWALLKIRDHVLDSRGTSIWEGVSRLVAAGAFFALPYVVEVMVTTVVGASAMTAQANTTFNETGGDCSAPVGLDIALYCLMDDMLVPIHALLNFFAFVAGIIFIMIGISRLMKSAQDGPKGPGGVGTLFTFLTGGILISFNSILAAFSQSIFGNPQTLTYATLRYSDGLEGDEIAHVHTVISAVIKFMIVVGLISFVRGWFIMRGVAEGNGQASAMAGVTHIIGGALAVNLGPLLNSIQQTLGITGLGITFGG